MNVKVTHHFPHLDRQEGSEMWYVEEQYESGEENRENANERHDPQLGGYSWQQSGVDEKVIVVFGGIGTVGLVVVMMMMIIVRRGRRGSGGQSRGDGGRDQGHDKAGQGG